MLDISKLTQDDINAGLIKVKEVLSKEDTKFDMANYVCGDWNDKVNICNTYMCIAGHLVVVLGEKHFVKNIINTCDILINSPRFRLTDLFMPNDNLFSEDRQQAINAIDEYLSGNTSNPWKE